MALVPFNDWWEMDENQQDFWRISRWGEAVSLGETPCYIFRQILQRLKGYHNDNVGYGNLIEGVRIDENNQVDLEAPNPEASNAETPLAQRLAFIKEDFLDFETLVTRVTDLILVERGVVPAYSFTTFHELCRLLEGDDYYRTEDELRRFGFYMRNNPLFLNEAAQFLFFRKVLTIKEFNNTFHLSVCLTGIQGWSGNVRDGRLRAVRDYRKDETSLYPTNYSTYRQPDGSIVFYRNCLGHVRSWNAPFDDAEILHALEDELPMVIPVWFHALVKHLDLDPVKCTTMCGSGWMEFLSIQPSVFT